MLSETGCYPVSTVRRGYLPVRMARMSDSLLRAWRGERLLMSRLRISSRICERMGSSSWKKLSCMPEAESIFGMAHDLLPLVVVDATGEWRLASSSWRSTFAARSTMARGMPASFATCMPKLCSLPPRASLRRNTTLPSISLTATLKFTTPG